MRNIKTSELVLGAQFLRFSPECYHGKAKSPKRNGSKGLETKSPGLARWGECDRTGAPALPLERERDSWRIMVVNLLFEDDSRSDQVGLA